MIVIKCLSANESKFNKLDDKFSRWRSSVAEEIPKACRTFLNFSIVTVFASSTIFYLKSF